MAEHSHPRSHGRTSAPAHGRRAFLGGALALAAGLLGCGGEQPGRWSGRFLTVATTGGALQDTLEGALFGPFRRATGCSLQDVRLPVGDLLREVRRQALVGRVQWDVVVLDAPHAAAAAAGTPGLFAPAAAPFAADTLALGYRTGPLGGRPPASWAAVWSGAVPGARLFPEDPVGLLEVALLADGVDPGALYPLDLDRAFASLDRLRDRNPAWWREVGNAAEDFTLGEADLLLTYGGQLRAAIDGGAVAAIAPLPSPLLPLTLNLTQRGPNADVARDFAAFARADEAQTALRDRGYGATGGLPPDALPLDTNWWAATGGEALDRFERWLMVAGRG